MLRGNICLSSGVSPMVLAIVRPLLLAGPAILLVAPIAAHAQEATSLEEINVEGRAQSAGAQQERADGPVKGFVATRTKAGAKTDTPLLEVPQSVSVIGRKQIEATGARTLGEATRYTAGVRELFTGADPRYDQYQIRGFDASTTGLYLDGLQLLTATGLPFRLEPYGLERIEALRGPSSVLYGGSNPGGLINAVTKRPTEQAFGEVTTGVNEFGNRYGAFDVGGPVGWSADAPATGEWYYRLTGLAKAGGTQNDFSEDERVYIAPAVTWKPDADTSFTLLGSYQRDRTTGVPFLPYKGTVTKAPFGRIPTDFATSKPHEGGLYNGVKREQAFIGYQFEKAVNDSLTIRQNARYSHGENKLFSIIGFGYLGPARDARLTRVGFAANPIADIVNVDSQAEVKFDTEGLAHTALFGLDYKHVEFKQETRLARATPIDIFDPDYTQPFPGLGAPSQKDRTRQDQYGFYAQDQIKFGKFSLVLSGRHDHVRSDFDNLLKRKKGFETTDDAFSGRAGLVYETDFGLAPYVSYSRSFQPLVGIDDLKKTPLKPERGEQYEAGVKFQPEGWRSFITAAVFDLTRQNFTVADGAFRETQSGEARSRGVEIEAVASLAQGLDLISAFTDFDIENTKNERPRLEGLRPANTPERFASAFLDYTVPTGALRGFGGGFGVRYMGVSYADDRNKKPIPSYTLADASLHFERDGWRAAVNVSNLFDKTFVVQCSTANQCFYGEGRKATASLTYRW